jgi:hypothetical protein
MLHRLLRLLPWLLTVAIFAYLLQRVPLREVLAALQRVPLVSYLALMVPYSLAYCSIDAYVLYRVVNWFHTPVPYRRILPVRAAAYILALLNPGLGQGGVAFALNRREGIPLLDITGSLLFLTMMEFAQLALYAAMGIFGFQPQLRAAFAPIYAVLVLLGGGGILCVRRGIDPLTLLLSWWRRWRRTETAAEEGTTSYRLGLLQTLRMAQPRHYLLTWLFKAPNFLLAVLVHYLALRFFEVEAPLVALLGFLPIVFLVASLPVTVAHLGTTQAAWLYFFMPYGEAPNILAYSLVAHVTFMVLNGVIGVCFLGAALQTQRA